ncbi:hypothetical protein ASPZODRAFT_1207208 [Penicilliopsis zonata CBS 506.65]|uniref:Uncharacterized protein n=1 Tax=Penicilliopsis zonata CBS 506.65 TaxID=1073090 RepID=A0A1L9S7C1_9EURO|nr:hypothetical protein ASPZODRAFT_1207208 [Penicilliopsis zonata CBS 506.65]OJJ43044.1 hypothetical protein ASPZODRAFT_1207208 [Penicilliopsis zonata CBS 506.65]
MSSAQIMQNLLNRGRQQLSTLRSRFGSSAEKQPRKETHLLRTSLSAHRPVWVTAGGGTYTTLERKTKKIQQKKSTLC